MKTNYRGIDYSLPNSTVNRDSKTGIRYGVISQNAVLQAWADSAEAEYNADLDEDELTVADPDYWYVDDGTYVAYQKSDSSDICIILSPYYTYAQFCSPCVPGACNLDAPLSEPHEANKCYCFGLDWFEDGNAPYDIYEIATGKLIYKAQ